MSDSGAILAGWKVVLAGGTAGVLEIMAMYPTDLVKTNQQLSAKPVGMLQSFHGVVLGQGVRGLYRGIATPILAEAPKRAWKFGANNEFKRLIASVSPDGKVSMIGGAAAGSLAGISEAVINCPFETIKVRMQAVENLARFSSSSECLKMLVKEEGVAALYLGLGPQMWRNGLWNGMYFGAIGVAAQKFPLPQGSTKGDRLLHKFVTGVVGSMLGTLANTPFDVVKSRMQQQVAPKSGEQLKYRNTFQSLRLIAKEEGTNALYKGLVPRLVRLGPGGGIMIVAFDFVSDLLRDF